MAPSVNLLTGRNQTLVVVLLAVLVAMGVSPLADILAAGWQLRFGEARWRFEFFQLVLANGPQTVILLVLIALFGVLLGNRLVVRSTAVALGLVAALSIVILPLYVMDFLQVHRMIPQDQKTALNGAVLKSTIFTFLIFAGGGWASLRGWQASEPADVTARREMGEGLVVGQAAPPRLPE
jgi:hypothetical protein